MKSCSNLPTGSTASRSMTRISGPRWPCRMRQGHRGPEIRVIDRDAVEPVDKFEQLFIRLLQAIVVTDDRHIVGHDLAHLVVQLELILVAALLDQLIVDLLLTFRLLLVNVRTVRSVTLHVRRPFDRRWRRD